MKSPVDYLGSGTGARIEPNRADNYNKTRTNNTKNIEFSKILNARITESINQTQKNTSRPNSTSSTTSTMGKNGIRAEYSNEAFELKQRIEAGMQARGKVDGTDFALMQVSSEFEQQILGILWNLAFSSMDREFEGGLGEELFHKELVNEMIKLADTGEMGEIAQNIYNNLKDQSGNSNKKTEIVKRRR